MPLQYSLSLLIPHHRFPIQRRNGVGSDRYRLVGYACLTGASVRKHDLQNSSEIVHDDRSSVLYKHCTQSTLMCWARGYVECDLDKSYATVSTLSCLYIITSIVPSMAPWRDDSTESWHRECIEQHPSRIVPVPAAAVDLAYEYFAFNSIIAPSQESLPMSSAIVAGSGVSEIDAAQCEGGRHLEAGNRSCRENNDGKRRWNAHAFPLRWADSLTALRRRRDGGLCSLRLSATQGITGPLWRAR